MTLTNHKQRRGTIDLEEFLQLKKVGSLKMSYTELKALFFAKDADGSGALDMDEFKQLCADAKLLDHKDAIMAHGATEKAKRDAEYNDKTALWKLGMPKKKPEPAKPPTERPSLVGVSEAIINMRKRMGSV